MKSAAPMYVFPSALEAVGQLAPAALLGVILFQNDAGEPEGFPACLCYTDSGKRIASGKSESLFDLWGKSVNFKGVIFLWQNTIMFIGGVNAVIDCDKPYPVGGENLAQVTPGFDVFTPQAGQVFDNHAVNGSLGDVLHHFLKVLI